MRCSSLTLRRMSSVVVPAGGGRVFPQSAPTRSRTREASVCSGFLPSGSSRSFLREEAVKMCAPAWPASIQSNKNVALSCLDFTCSSCLNYMFECSQLRENKWFHVQYWHKCWLPDTSCTKRRKKLPANWISVESCFTRESENCFTKVTSRTAWGAHHQERHILLPSIAIRSYLPFFQVHFSECAL